MRLQQNALVLLFGAFLCTEGFVSRPAFSTTAPTLSKVAQPLLQQQRRFLVLQAENKNEDGGEPTLIKSGRKEIAYDEASGRFFETGGDEGECNPEEEFCMLDKDTGQMIRLTLAEKERIFLDALQSYYTSGRQMLPDSDFDLLKEDLQWSGSDMTVMNRKEANYLNAMQAYLKGSPTMSDKEFDTLKNELMEEGSKFAVQKEPKCYIDTGICKATFDEDKFRSNLLYLPAGIFLTILWLGLGFELIDPLIRLNPLVLLVLGSPAIYNGAKFITEELVFPNKFIAYGPCPSCSFQNRVYFGDILGVEGFEDVAQVKCPNCKEIINVQRNTLRASTLPKQ